MTNPPPDPFCGNPNLVLGGGFPYAQDNCHLSSCNFLTNLIYGSASFLPAKTGTRNVIKIHQRFGTITILLFMPDVVHEFINEVLIDGYGRKLVAIWCVQMNQTSIVFNLIMFADFMEVYGSYSSEDCETDNCKKEGKRCREPVTSPEATLNRPWGEFLAVTIA